MNSAVFEGSSHFSSVCNDVGRENREVRNNNIIQRNSEIKEATIFMKLMYNFISAKQLLVLPITFFFFLRVFNKVPSREIGKKSESL